MTTKDVPDLLEQSVVQDGCVKPSVFPSGLVLDKIMEQLLCEPALVVNCVNDVLVNPLHDEWNCTHESWLEQSGITLGTSLDLGAFVSQCVSRTMVKLFSIVPN